MPPVTFKIRDSLDADVPAIHAIYAHHVLTGTGSFEEVPPDLAEMASRRTALIKDAFPYIVATDNDGTVIGYAYAGQFRPRAAYRYSVEDSIYIAPGQQGRGTGRALLGCLIERCEAMGMRQMIAIIGDSENLGSIGVHKSLGFHPAGVLSASGYKFGRWIDTVMMQRALGAGASNLPEAPSGQPAGATDTGSS